MLLKKFNEELPESHPYSYVIVRNDLSPAQKAVQGTHAAIELHKGIDINYHPSVIYVVVKDERKLKSVYNQLLDQGVKVSSFQEPDIGNEMTSICTEPLFDEERKFMQKFQLL